MTHNILGLLSLYPSARLSNHQSEAEENSTNLTAATTHTFTGPTRENTLLPWLGWECGYMCVSLISDSLRHTLSHTQKKKQYFLQEKQISSGFLLVKHVFWWSMRTSLVNKKKILDMELLEEIAIWIHDHLVPLNNKICFFFSVFSYWSDIAVHAKYCNL